jgi:hypothetical protein
MKDTESANRKLLSINKKRQLPKAVQCSVCYLPVKASAPDLLLEKKLKKNIKNVCVCSMKKQQGQRSGTGQISPSKV